jgi:predicted nucleic acid-binding protein
MTCLIDTDVLVDFFKHKTYAKGLIEKLSRTTTLTLSTLTITELRSGWTSEQAGFLLPRLYALCTVVPVTKEIAEQAGKWRGEYKSKGLSLSTPDTVIAATAYLNNSPLLTNNAKDYPMPELTLYKHTPEKTS